MKVKSLLLAAFLSGSSLAVAQTTIVVGVNSTNGYQWNTLVTPTGTGDNGVTNLGAASSPYHFTFTVNVSEPGALSGSFAVTMYATNATNAGTAYRLTEYLQTSLYLLAIDQPAVNTTESRFITSLEKLYLSVDSTNLVSLNGGTPTVSLNSFTTYGLSTALANETVTLSSNGTALATFTGGGSDSYDASGAMTYTTNHALAEGEVLSWLSSTGQYRVGSFTFEAESMVSSVPEPSTYAALAGAVALVGAVYFRRKNSLSQRQA